MPKSIASSQGLFDQTMAWQSFFETNAPCQEFLMHT